MKYITDYHIDEEKVLEMVMDFINSAIPCYPGYEETTAGELFEVFQDEILKDCNTAIIAVDLIVMPERGIIAYDSERHLYIKYTLFLPIIGNGKYRECIYLSDDAQNWRPVVVIINADDNNSGKYYYPNFNALDNPVDDECIENRIIDAYQKF